jgi:5-methyltetrahydrofolate--homocysteine methyltransferase
MCPAPAFEIIDLGTDSDPQAFVDAIREHKPKLVGLSALLTTTMVKYEDHH